MHRCRPRSGRGARGGPPRGSARGLFFFSFAIASIANLPASSAMVWVGPPLFWSPFGSSARLVSLTLSPIVSPLAAMLFPNPQVPSSEMLEPPLVTGGVPVPAQLPPEVLLAKMLLVTVALPALSMAPPLLEGALLPEKVLVLPSSGAPP